MPVLNFRTDQRSEEALAELTADGSTTSEAIRQALVDAVRLRRREQMRAESRRLANETKTSPRAEESSPRWTSFVRGDVHRLRAPKTTRGHEQRGERYAVILQSDDLILSTVLVAPTSTSSARQTFRPTIEIGNEPTQVLVEQTAAVTAERLGAFVGQLSVNELADVDQALRLVLELD